MDTQQAYRELARLCKVLAHPTRLQILDILRRGDECVCHISAVTGKRQAYISQQLMILRAAGLVAACREGLNVFYKLTDPAVLPLLEEYLGKADERHRPEQCRCPKCTGTLSESPCSERR